MDMIYTFGAWTRPSTAPSAFWEGSAGITSQPHTVGRDRDPMMSGNDMEPLDQSEGNQEKGNDKLRDAVWHDKAFAYLGVSQAHRNPCHNFEALLAKTRPPTFSW